MSLSRRAGRLPPDDEDAGQPDPDLDLVVRIVAVMQGDLSHLSETVVMIRRRSG
jgi:hypothetical protein